MIDFQPYKQFLVKPLKDRFSFHGVSVCYLATLAKNSLSRTKVHKPRQGHSREFEEAKKKNKTKNKTKTRPLFELGQKSRFVEQVLG